MTQQDGKWFLSAAPVIIQTNLWKDIVSFQEHREAGKEGEEISEQGLMWGDGTSQPRQGKR